FRIPVLLSVRCLQVDRPRIVYAGLYSIIGEVFFHLVPVFRPDYEQVVDGPLEAWLHRWKNDVSHIFELLSVLFGFPSSCLVPSIQSLQLDSPNGSIDCVEPRCEAYSTVIVFAILVPATVSYAPCGIGHFLIIRCYDAPVTAYGHVLRRIEREASGITDRTDLSSFEFGAVSLA